MSNAGQIRTFNRFYTNFLGLLNNRILESPLSLSESRILYEIAQKDALPASELVSLLHVDKGYLSRVLKKFEKAGYINKTVSNVDARVQDIRLTPDGRSLFHHINKQSEQQIQSLTAHLDRQQKNRLAWMLKKAEQMLTKPSEISVLKEVKIRTNFAPGDIGFAVNHQCDLYYSEFDYGVEFERYVAKGVVELYETYHPEESRIWVCEHLSKRIGFLALVNRGSSAQLRFFFILKPYRGIGLGKRLMQLYMDFLHQAGYSSSYLWTTHEQLAAAALYKKHGFKLIEEKPSGQFGKKLIEQKYILNLI